MSTAYRFLGSALLHFAPAALFLLAWPGLVLAQEADVVIEHLAEPSAGSAAFYHPAEAPTVRVVTGGMLRAKHLASMRAETWDLTAAVVGYEDLVAIGATVPDGPFLAANVRRSTTGESPFASHVIRDVGGTRVAFLGVTQVPTHATTLVDLGAWEILDSAEVLESLLKEIAGQADLVVLLAAMDRIECARLLRAVPGIHAALVASETAYGFEPLSVGASHLITSPVASHSFARLSMRRDGSGWQPRSNSIVRVRLDDSDKARIREIHAAGGGASEPSSLFAGTPSAAESEIALPERIELGQTIALALHAKNRGAELDLSSMRLLSSYGGREAPAGHAWLVLHGTWRNVIPLVFAFERELPVTYAIINPRDHFYVVVDGRRLGRLDTELTGGPGGVAPGALTLPRLGSERAGNLVFSVPVEGAPKSLELRFYDYAHGHMVLPLLTGEAPTFTPRDETLQNRVLEAGIYGFEKTATLGSRTAPAGMTFAVVDLRARSRFTYEADATAFDPKAKAGETIQIGTVADWKETEKYLQAVVDGEFAYGLEPETTLPAVPRFLPDTPTGERAVFLVPEEYTSLELRCDFPNAAPPSGEVFHPLPLVFPLEGERPPRPAREALLDINDEFVAVTVTGQEARASFAGEPAGANKKFLVLDVSVRSLSDKGELFQTPQHLQYVAEDGSRISLDETSGRGLRRTVDVLYVPKGEHRSFEAAFRIPADDGKPRLAYHGVSMAEVFDLPPLTDVVAPDEVIADADPPPSPPDPPAETTTVVPPTRPADLPALAGGPVSDFTPVAVRGAGVELSVLDGRLTRECLNRTAEEGRIFLLLQIVWRRLGPEQRWRSGYISDAFFLHCGGLSLERVWGSCWGNEGYLPGSIALDGDEDTLACTVVFEVYDGEPLGSSSLVFLPREGAPLVLPFVAPFRNPTPLPVLARAENEILEVTAHDFVEPTPELVKRIGTNMPEGKELVCLRVSAAAKGRPFELYHSSVGEFLQLIAEGSFPCPSFFWAGRYRVEGWPMWTRDMRLLPGVRDHGVLAFAVPKRDAQLALEFHLPEAQGPDGKPVAESMLELPLTRGKLRPPAPALARIEENGWEVEVLGLRAHGTREHPEVAMDIRVRTSQTGRQVKFGRQALNVRDQSGRQQHWTSRQVHPYEFADQIHLDAGKDRRFDVCFRAADPGTYLWLQVPTKCPTRMVKLPNPWVPADRARLAAGEALEVITAPELEIVHAPPSLFPEPAPGGIEGAGLTGAQVNEAIRRGAHFLMDKHPEGFRLDQEDHILVILALLHSRELEKNPELMAHAVRCAEQRPLGTVYDAALTLMTLAWLDPERYRPRIQEIAQALVEAQGEAGGWNYSQDYVRDIAPLAVEEEAAEEDTPPGRIDVQGGEPIAGWPGTEEVGVVSLERQTDIVRTGGDNSCSQYAVLGLTTAFNSGVHAPRGTWERAVKWYQEGHDPGRGWGYGRGNKSTGSMTTAGLAGLSVSSFHVGKRPEEVETLLGLGVDWLARNFLVNSNPGDTGWHLYYLYGLERAGRLLGKEFFGPHEWYPLGARFLVSSQAGSGSWTGKGSNNHEIRDTAFGLLFLTLATEKLGTPEVLPTGPGKLTVLTPGTGGSVVFILDASGSMGADLGEETRFDAARRVVLEVLETGGAGLEVALRVYGHRYPSIDKRANEDSELVVGFGPPDRPELATKLNGLRFRGKTPLTFSLIAALEDLRGATGDTPRVVLLTDGAESDRRAKPIQAAEALKAAGVRLDVVCLAMDNTQLLERMAAAGGGSCYTAGDAEQLLGAISATVIGTVPFRVLDAEGGQVAAGESGTEVTLPAGPYTVEIDLPDGTETVPVWIHQERTTRIAVRAQ